ISDKKLHLFRLGQSLVVIDVVFLIVGLPSIVSARFGFQDLVFGDLTSMLFFIVEDGSVDFILSLFIFLFFHLIAPFIADHVSGGSPFRHICYSRFEVFFSVYALCAWKSFVVLRWHGRLVCACLVCEVVVVLPL
ncbi:LOW QUALITY PROTEIN: hypothetical protein HID58_015829, partial [Brassica napus]